jgi:ribosomal protein S18 acetylase RimI-like enzyme
MGFAIQGPLLNQSSGCTPILRLLPDWFGIEDAILKYEQEIKVLPTFLVRSENRVVGFLSLKQHNPYSSEIYVMAIHPDMHRCGIGRALVEAAEAHTRRLGVEYMQVKTLGPSRPDESFAYTRLFYEAVGFRPLEEFPKFWDEHNPCLLMVKRL